MAGFVQDQYDHAARDVGPPALPAFMDRWFAARKSLSDEANAAGPSAKDLGDMEISARETFGKMQNQLAQSRTSDRKGAYDALGKWIAGTATTTAADANAGSRVSVAKLSLEEAMAKIADEATSKVSAAAAYSDSSKTAIDAAAQAASQSQQNGETNADAIARSVAGKFAAAAANDKAGGFGSTKYDAMVRDQYNRMRDLGVSKDVADKFAAIVQPNRQIDGKPVDTNEWFAVKYGTETLDKAHERAKGIARQYGGGGANANFNKNLAQNGINPSTFGQGGGESTTTGGSTSGGGAGSPRTGGSISLAGLAPAAQQRFAAVLAEGGDPYQAMVDGLAEQQKYIDDLAAQRRAALTKSAFPRANPYVATPNTYQPDRSVNALRAVGETDPGLNSEWAPALRQNHGNIDRAYRQIGSQGGASARFTPGDFIPENVDSGGDLGGYLADMLIAGGDLKEAARVVSAQPAEVQALFDAVRQAKDPKNAAELAKNIDPDEVRAAYGYAMRRAEHDPDEVSRVLAGLDALPEDVRKGWSDGFYRALDEHAAGVKTGGYMASGAMQGSIGRLGESLQQTGVKDAREARTAVEDRGELLARRERESADQGRVAALNAWNGAQDDAGRAKVVEGWNRAHAAASSPMTAGAIDALKEAQAGRAATVEQQITHTPVRTVPVRAPTDTMNAIVPETLDRDWKDQGDEMSALDDFEAEPPLKTEAKKATGLAKEDTDSLDDFEAEGTK